MREYNAVLAEKNIKVAWLKLLLPDAQQEGPQEKGKSKGEGKGTKAAKKGNVGERCNTRE